MITIQLNEHSAEDYRAIQQLRKLGYDEEEIQQLYDEQQEKDRQEKTKGRCGMIRKYIIEADDSIKGFDKEIAKLEREWGAEEIEPSEDAISRDAVMKCFKKWQPYMATRILGYEQELSQLPSVTPQQTRWIPCSERLPKTRGAYLVTTKWESSFSSEVYTEIDIAVYRDKLKEWSNPDVIAWMPLPEPYKTESEDEE